MEHIIITGRLGADAEVKTSGKGNKYLTMRLASNKFSEGKEVTTWWEAIATNADRYERMAKYLTKGKSVIVTGDPSFSSYETNTGELRLKHTVLVDRIDFNTDNTGQKNESNGGVNANSSPKAESKSKNTGRETAKAKEAPTEDFEIPMKKSDEPSDDDLPF